MIERYAPVLVTFCRGKADRTYCEKRRRTKKKKKTLALKVRLGWKVKTRKFNCLNSKNVSSAYWSNTDISMYSFYKYIFSQKLKSQTKRELDIKLIKSDLDRYTRFCPMLPGPPVVSCLTCIYSPQLPLSTKCRTLYWHGFLATISKVILKIQVKTDFLFNPAFLLLSF